MSLKNHPNFHACNFVTDIVSSYYESLRGPYFSQKDAPRLAPNIKLLVARFVADVEDLVDKTVTNSRSKE
jgi:hypothetical protein